MEVDESLRPSIKVSAIFLRKSFNGAELFEKWFETVEGSFSCTLHFFSVSHISNALGNTVRTARDDDAEFVSVGVREHYPANIAFAGASYEVAAELKSPFGNVIGVVRVEVNVTTGGGDVVDVAGLKRQMRASSGGVAQSERRPIHGSWLVPRERSPKLAEPLWIRTVEHDVSRPERCRHLVSRALPGDGLITSKVETHIDECRDTVAGSKYS